MTTVGGDRALVDCERAVSTADDSTRTGELADRIRASKAGISSTGRSTGGELQGRGVQTSEEQIVSATYTLVRDRATEATAPATEIPDVGIELAITRATKVQSATTRQRTADVIITAGCINDGSTGSSCCDDVIRVIGVASHILRQYTSRKRDRPGSRSCCISQNQGSRTKGRAAGMAVGYVECGRTCACLLNAACTTDRIAELRALGDGITLVNDEGAATGNADGIKIGHRTTGATRAQLKAASTTANGEACRGVSKISSGSECASVGNCQGISGRATDGGVTGYRNDRSATINDDISSTCRIIHGEVAGESGRAAAENLKSSRAAGTLVGVEEPGGESAAILYGECGITHRGATGPIESLTIVHRQGAPAADRC